MILWNFLLKRKQFSILIMAILVIAGTISAIRITKESAPEVKIPIGIITVVLPGASASDVEKLITDKIERRISNLQNIDKLTSTSYEGLSVVRAEFDASADIDSSIQKLKDEIDKVKPELPADAKEPSVIDIDFVDQPVQIISVSSDAPYSALATLSDTLKNEITSIPGVSNVEVSGIRHREITIVLRKEELARRNISPSQIIQAIAAQNISIPIGSITTNDILYSISFDGSLDKTMDFGSISILGNNGYSVLLRDIADVQDGVERTNHYSRISSNGMPSEQSFTLAIFKVRGYDVTQVTSDVRTRLDELKNNILNGSTILITNDAGKKVQDDLSELIQTGIETIILVMLALLATIGWRESVIAGLSIPLSFLISFIGLYYSGNTINFLSLFSLILAIGILVDSGIVVVEAIHTRAKSCEDNMRAAHGALQEYSYPLIGGTLTTVAVFVPLFFISGIVGQFIASIPFTLIFVLIASIFVALGQVPILSVLFSKRKDNSLTQRQEAYAISARKHYAEFLKKLFLNKSSQNTFLVAIMSAFVISLSLPFVGLLKVAFFPQDDAPYIYIDIEMPQGTSLNATDMAVREVEELLYGISSVESLITTVGASSMFSSSDGGKSDTRYANIIVNLSDKEKREETSSDILTNVKSRLSTVHSAIVRVGQPTGGPPVGAPILINYTGQDSVALEQSVATARLILESTPGATDIDTGNKNDATQYHIGINRSVLAEAGITPAQVASLLRTAISGTTATKISDGDYDVDIKVALNLNTSSSNPHDASKVNIDAIRAIPVSTTKGSIPLGSLVEISAGYVSSTINHENRKRIISITANVLPNYTAYEVLAEFKKRSEDIILPSSIEQSIGGENEQTDKSFAEMGLALIAGLALMLIILVMMFDSIRYALYLLSIVPLSLIGVLGGLSITGQPLSFSSLLGVIALSGVIINHAIILLDGIMRRMRVEQSVALADAVIDAATSRLRPIFLTTITTVIGMIPLTIVSSLWGPLAFAILFGLTFAMILTLVLVPLLVYKWPGKLPANVTN